jgi:hypothetical protein
MPLVPQARRREGPVLEVRHPALPVVRDRHRERVHRALHHLRQGPAGRPGDPAVSATLFDVHVLWHRASRRHKWRVVGRAHSGPAALELMDSSGLKGGHWMLTEGDADPNAREPKEPDGDPVQGPRAG